MDGNIVISILQTVIRKATAILGELSGILDNLGGLQSAVEYIVRSVS